MIGRETSRCAGQNYNPGARTPSSALLPIAGSRPWCAVSEARRHPAIRARAADGNAANWSDLKSFFPHQRNIRLTPLISLLQTTPVETKTK